MKEERLKHPELDISETDLREYGFIIYIKAWEEATSVEELLNTTNAAPNLFFTNQEYRQRIMAPLQPTTPIDPNTSTAPEETLRNRQKVMIENTLRMVAILGQPSDNRVAVVEVEDRDHEIPSKEEAAALTEEMKRNLETLFDHFRAFSTHTLKGNKSMAFQFLAPFVKHLDDYNRRTMFSFQQSMKRKRDELVNQEAETFAKARRIEMTQPPDIDFATDPEILLHILSFLKPLEELFVVRQVSKYFRNFIATNCTRLLRRCSLPMRLLYNVSNKFLAPERMGQEDDDALSLEMDDHQAVHSLHYRKACVLAQVECLVQMLAEKNVDLGMQIRKSDLDLLRATVETFLNQALICIECNHRISTNQSTVLASTLCKLGTNFLFIDNSKFHDQSRFMFPPTVREVILPNCPNALKVALFLQHSSASSIHKMISKQILHYKIETNVPCEVYYIEGPEISISTDVQFELPEKFILYTRIGL